MLYQISLSAGSSLTRSDAERITGGLSHPSKMPCPAYSLPAQECKMGSILAQIKGTTCHGCYALKGFYQFPKVHEALVRRLDSLKDPSWIEAMVVLIGKNKFFRWHDSGDIQSLEHLKMIVEVARRLPKTKFWLPTREYSIVKLFQLDGKIPKNLVIRLSAHLVDAAPPKGYGLPTSSVHTKGNKVYGEECMAYTRENKCGECRSCWDKRVKNVSYHKH